MWTSTSLNRSYSLKCLTLTTVPVTGANTSEPGFAPTSAAVSGLPGRARHIRSTVPASHASGPLSCADASRCVERSFFALVMFASGTLVLSRRA